MEYKVRNKLKYKINRILNKFYNLYQKAKDIILKKKKLEEICEKLIEVIPEEKPYLEESIRFNKELLGHVYFADDFTNHLIELLNEYKDLDTIKRYCNFIEYMWRKGDSYVVNIFDVTIAENLSDYKTTWTRFGKNISNELIEYINKTLLVKNILMINKPPLDKN